MLRLKLTLLYFLFYSLLSCDNNSGTIKEYSPNDSTRIIYKATNDTCGFNYIYNKD
jgi:hypothetical protein